MDRAHRLHPAREEGSFLVEVMVTATLLITLSLGVLLAMEGASAASAEQRLRTQALSVAQTELDLLRAQRFNDLRTLAATPRTVTSGGRDFTVTATVTPVAQTAAPAGCSVRRSRDALQATVEVRWGSIGTRAPVRLTSIVSAPVGAGGGLLATVKGARNQPVDGLPMTLAGPGGTTATTDATGCARWDNLRGAATYGVSFDRALWVDPQGRQQVSRTLTVAPEAMNTTSFAYDLAGGAQLRFRTNRRDPLTNAVASVPSQPPVVTFDNTSVDPIQRSLAWTDAAVRLAHATPLGREVGGLFPFETTRYAVFAGQCETAMPPSGANRVEVLVPRGAVTRNGLEAHEVRLPSLDLRVTNGGVPVPAGTTVEIRSCSQVFATRPVKADGTVDDPGLPYGRIGLCVSAPSADGTRPRDRQAWTQLDVTGFGTPPTTTLPLVANPGTGSLCPAL